jgi:flavin reductase (DIM6/NTAB) family NADH-FMN oxidoreductase RutF
MTVELYAVLGRIPSGVFILTAGTGDNATGMLASWVMQAGFEPPMITVAIRQGRHVAERLVRGEPFVLNVVGEGQKLLLSHFGRGFEPDEPAFVGLNVHLSTHGVPVLAEALGHLECQRVSHVDAADHRVFLAVVTGGRLASDRAPMVHIRKTGTHY